MHRHDSPKFARSDWSWVYPLIEATRAEPGWFRRLPEEEKKKINDRFWAEGRSQVEDWLLRGVRGRRVQIRSNTTVSDCTVSTDGDLRIALSDGESLVVDHVILATGYKIDMRRVSLIARGNIGAKLACHEGFPVLDESFQSNLPGLYFTGIHAVKDFGPLLFFVACSFVAAEIVGKSILRSR